MAALDRETAGAPVQGLPADYYRSPEVFAAVRDRLFCRTWQFACHASRLPRPGSYLAFSIFDQELFVLRDRDGDLRCFFNVCRHRGHLLLEGTGRSNLIVCPYHAWSYDLDGRLRKAPRTGGLPGFAEQEICLSEVRLENLCGFLFVNLDPEAPALSEAFPGLEAAIRALCPDIEQRAFAEEYEALEDCNWLVAVENYNECYHCKVAHRTFASGVIDPQSYDIRAFEAAKGLRHSAKAQGGEAAWYDTSGSDYGSFFLWPGFSLQIYPSGLVNSYHWRPLSEETTRVHRGWYAPEGQVDARLRKVIDLDRETTFAEDLALVRGVQRGLRSRGYRPGPLVVNPAGGIDSEHSVALLHDWLREALDG